MSPSTEPLNLDLLRRLSEARGVSGDEGRVRRILVDAVGDRLEDLRADAIGNLYGRRSAVGVPSGGRPAPRVMLAAHMDEVGLMVTRVGRDGLLGVDAVGGLDARVLAGQAVLVGTEGLPGVIGLKPVHLSSAGERERPPRIEDLRVDIGVDGGDAAEGLVTLGDAGSVYKDRLVQLRLPAFAVQAVDPTAAGDAYVGTLAVSLARGEMLPQAMRHASAVAALTVTRPGAQSSFPSRQEVEAFLAAR